MGVTRTMVGMLAAGALALLALADDTTVERGARDASAPTLTLAVGEDTSPSEAKEPIPNPTLNTRRPS